jgi:protein SCO1
MAPRLSLLMLLGALLVACGHPTAAPQFESTDVTGVVFGRDFSLRDPAGLHRTLADFRGKVVVLFFGYASCPDVCPTSLSELALALQKMGPEASGKVQVLFVTLDPERDTPSLLARYVPAFNPSFLGLYGSEDETALTAREFKILYEKRGEGPHYAMDHSAGTYIYDPSGRLRLFARPGHGADRYAHDIQALLDAHGGRRHPFQAAIRTPG